MLDVHCGRYRYPELRRTVLELARRESPDAVLIENRGSGMALIDDLYDEDPPDFPEVSAFDPEGDKVTRMAAVSALIERGQVHIPREAPWLAQFYREMMQFPHGRHDDQVDSVSQYLNWAQDQLRHAPQVAWV